MREFENGFKIEELEYGLSSAKIAKPGKKI